MLSDMHALLHSNELVDLPALAALRLIAGIVILLSLNDRTSVKVIKWKAASKTSGEIQRRDRCIIDRIGSRERSHDGNAGDHSRKSARMDVENEFQ